MSKKILVVGAGAWGTAIANVLSKNNNKEIGRAHVRTPVTS